MRQLDLYNNNIRYDYITKFHSKNIITPKLAKIVLSISSRKDSSLISDSLAIEVISTQKTMMYTLKKPNDKVRNGVGCKVTVRKNNLLTLLSNHLIQRKTSYIESSSIEIIENNYHLFKELSKIKVFFVFKNYGKDHHKFMLKSFKV
jgi:ribosomal protein L5